ncbi:bifunctional tRNA (5-methylaminomethyl-2-thiouridine)(34)-methyltransferase MnmD/FAD-dependent 5-carboxymethylaminomethyl-2-thiouridine(34) oxidoreductase MnmC [Alteromonas sp. D210916BOD_24]|uniref:bifunctional tRNA (5-methylaminomethyl-2-thiouridine)(34)-methyltransferase MnmD/FAD-dependent 5-carboxymethylaminomethyl-2-thiouridine(34) oxidoreductase MnmC n=1 Tax=Alteromonas sp. D210916BOD_24 TaxID=3157618 RepID=UPI00399CA04A
MKSKQARVHFNDNGTPVADHFDDVYFSNDSGIDETQHVFIMGNKLAERWQTCIQHSFVIAETGFGTGLNFLVAMRAFNEFRLANPSHPLKQLYFISTEKFPLPQEDLRRALSAFPALQVEAQMLTKDYPMGLEGCHRIAFPACSTTLDLWIGDIHELLPQWHTPKEGLVDAWFLDGFAPSKNPDMWTDALFSQMARLSKSGTTFGTFTAAGIVKRGLADVGFIVEKTKGFGRKRDMLIGTFETQNPTTNHRLRRPPGPYYRYNNVPLSANHHVVVVGSGLGAAVTCLSLAKRGIPTTLCFDKETLATGASGNPQGGFYPQLHSEASIPSRLQAHSFLYARQTFATLVARYPSVPHDFCGVIQLGFNENTQQRQKKLVQSDVWPEQLVKAIDAETASRIANVELPNSGLFIELGGWIAPGPLVNAMIEEAQRIGDLTLLAQHHYVAHRIKEEDDAAPIEVSFTTSDKEVAIHGDHLVLCLGAEAVKHSAFDSLPLRPVRGQVEAIPTQSPLSDLNTVLCHKGYLTPALNGRHALGSTYVKNDMLTQVRDAESEVNLSTHRQALQNTTLMNNLVHDNTARAAIRLGSPDHQPLVGQLYDFSTLKPTFSELGLGKPLESVATLPKCAVSTVTCLGSRGLTTAPLMAEILISSLCDEPLPLNNDLLNALNTSRFMVREAIRSE